MDGTFNFLYLPYHPTSGSSGKWPKGYAFINFLKPELALAFQEKWHGQCLSTTGRTKPLVIAAAPLQGVEDNLKELLGKDFMKLSRTNNLPALFYGTLRVNTEAILCMMRSERKQASTDANFSRISL